MYNAKKVLKGLFPIYTKEITIVLVIILGILLLQLFEQDYGHIVKSLERPNYFNGDEDVTLYYDYQELDIDNKPITFELGRSEVIDDDLTKFLEYMKGYINNDITSQYEGFKYITGPIILKDRYEECRIYYSLLPEKYVNKNGWLHYDLWDEQQSIKINFTLVFEDRQIEDSIVLDIRRDSFTKDYKEAYLEEKLLLTINQLNETYEGDEVKLPEDVVFYDKQKTNSLLLLLGIWIGIVTSCSLLVYYELGLRNAEEKNKRKVELTYFINSFTLLYQTGMTIQKSFLITIENRLLALEEEDSVYKDLSKIRAVIQSDQKFQLVLHTFSDYFDLRECRRFNRLLLQTLKQGDEHLVEQLDHMTRLLWDERIRGARKESEKASSKLVFPMLLIFIVILIISIVPTFLEVKSIF